MSCTRALGFPPRTMEQEAALSILWILTGPEITMLAGFLFLLLITDGVSSERNCSYQDVVDYLNLTNNKDLFSLTRPVKNYKQPTEVTLDVLLYGILDVHEKDQKLVSYVWIDMWWKNEFIAWDPEEFCGIKSFSFPAEFLWKPDITIHEMTEKDKGPRSPYLIVENTGDVVLTDDQVLSTTCSMHVHKFPFDIQSCSLTFKSIVHTVNEILLVKYHDSKKTTEFTHQLIQTQYEWLFIDMRVTNTCINQFDFQQSTIVYTVSFLSALCTTVDVSRLEQIILLLQPVYLSTCSCFSLAFVKCQGQPPDTDIISQITMGRKSALYIVNFLLPVMFFLILDLASFLISDSGGEKVGFKITLLLAVTVLQLILNEILPASSNTIPLISLYCVGIFGLMMLSLLETILVLYLSNKDAASQDNEANQDKGQSEDDSMKCMKTTSCGRPDESTVEMLSVAKEESNSQLRVESHDFEKLSDELMEALKTLTVVLNNKKEEQKPGYWTRMAKTINKVFFICYVIATTAFLKSMFSDWIAE
ncbi:LOW QUALITY PROTEIN: 5-hydroxytryptamine receptor 3A-like [Larimichthys crocea]|uniref:LOW QUALITY PROTEIN: 5-hydroxytryptamine receptor 3A-like n=1 Tax=Larimichthys crocea TaxID=215358 RepID=UPI000F60349C|nr:LOW QUALITY PROTEIN: 5-hydroxytryptamine receptor 3A-like [Larimichthys crocea]